MPPPWDHCLAWALGLGLGLAGPGPWSGQAWAWALGWAWLGPGLGRAGAGMLWALGLGGLVGPIGLHLHMISPWQHRQSKNVCVQAGTNVTCCN